VQDYGGYGVERHFQQYFSYILAVSFIGGGNRSTRRKPSGMMVKSRHTQILVWSSEVMVNLF
jgi:hypothetical protein